jgi:hypothetical protein
LEGFWNLLQVVLRSNLTNKNMLLKTLFVASSLLVSSASAWNWPSPWGDAGDNKWTTSVEAFAAREYFYVGGNYVNTTSGHLFSNQMYVEKLIPKKISQKYPLVFIHGQGQTGTVSSRDIQCQGSELRLHCRIG